MNKWEDLSVDKWLTKGRLHRKCKVSVMPVWQNGQLNAKLVKKGLQNNIAKTNNKHPELSSLLMAFRAGHCFLFPRNQNLPPGRKTIRDYVDRFYYCKQHSNAFSYKTPCCFHFKRLFLFFVFAASLTEIQQARLK